MTRVNILIGAGGRRNYLVNWFREAMTGLGIDGTVNVVDNNPYAPALADGDRSAVIPPFGSLDYFPALDSLCEEWDVTLAFSLNDFESSLWAASPSSCFRRLGSRVQLIAASQTCQELVEDKARYFATLARAGISSPETVLASDALASGKLPWRGDGTIVKNRFGSGSLGLQRTTRDRWRESVDAAVPTATDRAGRRCANRHEAMQSIVVQEAIEGVEFGIDIVHDLAGVPAGILARRKLRMRSGETDQATSVPADRFGELAERVSTLTAHKGLIDLDVIQDDAGQLHVIDVNPRFGGGYPFSHAAGANVPAAYLAWHAGLDVDEEWLRCQAGITSAKTEDIRLSRVGDYADLRSR